EREGRESEREILECLHPDHPASLVAIQKSAQTGLSQLGICWIANLVVSSPGPMMLVLPTINLAQDFNRLKLHPTIEASTALNRRIMEVKSRSKTASTALSKFFPGGSLVIVGANSPSDLRSKTIQYVVCDEIDEWPIDLSGQGDPMEMVKARQKSYQSSGNFKRLVVSTPTLAGTSRIEAIFLEGDQRYWHVPCPHCDEYQRLEFGGRDADYGMRFSSEQRGTHYVCKHCGGVIEHWQKRDMLARGKWVATYPDEGRQPSFHVNALMSPFETWDNIEKEFRQARGDQQRLKAFVNLTLGEVYEERGDAPDWSRLFARRADYPGLHIPTGGLVITAGVDVQKDGLFYEVVVWGRDRQSWSIDADFLEGETATLDSSPWQRLTRVMERHFPDAYGNTRPIDCLAIDSGYNTNTVYQWVRKNSNAHAIKGQAGNYRAIIATSPSNVDVSINGSKVRRGVQLWSIGTWAAKSELYANLAKRGIREGESDDPPGYCHFSANVNDETHLRQLTAETLKQRTKSGRIVREWVAMGANHFHDCRIYAMAAFAIVGGYKLNDDEWDELARDRTTRPDEIQGNLLNPVPQANPANVARSNYVGDTQDWLGQ
ncbi:MAG: terminase gpA endonuclease subunit, partial [Pseudomonadota bacterium]